MTCTIFTVKVIFKSLENHTSLEASACLSYIVKRIAKKGGRKILFLWIIYLLVLFRDIDTKIVAYT